MSQSTPINQLPRENMNNVHQQNHTSSDMVDDILNEMSTNDELNTESFNHMMDPSQVPPEKMEENFLNNNNYNQQDNQINEDNQNNKDNQNNNNKDNTQNNELKESFMSKLKGGNIEELFKNCLKQVKYSIVVFFLVMMVSLPQFNRFVFTKVKGMLLESGEINMKGVLLKGVVATVLFLILSFII